MSYYKYIILKLQGNNYRNLAFTLKSYFQYVFLKGDDNMNMQALLIILVFLGIMIVGIYLLNKIDSRKANSFLQDKNQNLSQFHENDNQNHP